jgi:M6 family metalloprotease-like protein
MVVSVGPEFDEYPEGLVRHFCLGTGVLREKRVIHPLGKSVNNNRIGIRSISLAVVFLSLLGLASAAPLSYVPQRLMQPDGTFLECFASGDEYYNWLHDQLGYTIVQNPVTGYYVYALPGKRSLTPSALVPGRDNPALLGVDPWLAIPASAAEERRAAWIAALPGSPANAPTLGSFTNIAIFIRFSDESKFTDTYSKYELMFNDQTVGTSSLYNYYREVSYGGVSITTNLYPVPSGGTTVISYQDSHPRGYYQPYNATSNPIGYQGGDDGSERTTREHALLKAAVDSIGPFVPASVNLDSDNDGRVDNVVFIVRGSPTGWSSLLWPHQWVLYSVTATINGKRVYAYNLQLESSISVGVLCHEMGHSLGMPDLYHYNSTPVTPIGSWDIMATSTSTPMHMGAYMKYKYGKWIPSPPILAVPGTYSIKPLTSSTGNVYRILSPYSSSEYFVLEYRKKVGIFERSLPGEGLLVYRINSTRSGNAQGPPDELYIYRPGGTTTVNGTLSSAAFSSEAERTGINDETNPSTFLTSGAPGGLALSSVGTRGDSITFVLGVPVTAVVDSFTALYVRPDSILVSWIARAQYRSLGFALELSDSTPTGYLPVAGSSMNGGGTTATSIWYSFVDRLNPGKKYYRIKEIDSSSAVRYSSKVAAVNFPAAAVSEAMPLPYRFEVLQNYPNPFNPKTVVSYQLPVVSEVRLVVYDLLGREVSVLVNEKQPAGSYSVTFQAGGLASGMYLYRMTAGEFHQTHTMLLLK